MVALIAYLSRTIVSNFSESVCFDNTKMEQMFHAYLINISSDGFRLTDPYLLRSTDDDDELRSEGI